MITTFGVLHKREQHNLKTIHPHIWAKKNWSFRNKSFFQKYLFVFLLWWGPLKTFWNNFGNTFSKNCLLKFVDSCLWKWITHLNMFLIFRWNKQYLWKIEINKFTICHSKIKKYANGDNYSFILIFIVIVKKESYYCKSQINIIEIYFL